MSDKDKIKKAKDIIAEISNLTHYHDDGYTPKGYGNWELNKAVDAMYGYIKTIQEEPNKVKS